MFLHDGAMHLFWNTLALFMFGFRSERMLGKKKYVGLLICGSLFGFLLSNVVSPCPFKVGASASLFALIAFQVLSFIANYERMGPHRAYYALIMAFMLGFILLNDVFLAGENVDAVGHLGGLAAGLMISVFFYEGELN